MKDPCGDYGHTRLHYQNTGTLVQLVLSQLLPIDPTQEA